MHAGKAYRCQSQHHPGGCMDGNKELAPAISMDPKEGRGMVSNMRVLHAFWRTAGAQRHGLGTFPDLQLPGLQFPSRCRSSRPSRAQRRQVKPAQREMRSGAKPKVRWARLHAAQYTKFHVEMLCIGAAGKHRCHVALHVLQGRPFKGKPRRPVKVNVEPK